MFRPYLNIESGIQVPIKHNIIEFVYFQIDIHVYIFYFSQMQIHSEDPVIIWT